MNENGEASIKIIYETDNEDSENDYQNISNDPLPAGIFPIFFVNAEPSISPFKIDIPNN